MKQQRIIPILTGFLIIMGILFSCQKSRYQKDKMNKLSKHTKKADDFIAKQSIEITQNNIEERENEVEKSMKKLQRDQKELKAAAKKRKKEKESPKHNGDFKFY